MTAIIALVSGRGASTSDGALRRSFCAGRRGADRLTAWRASDIVVASAAFEWEGASGLSGFQATYHDDRVAVTADAALYYRGELRRALANAGLPSDPGCGAAALIGKAYRAWGRACLTRLEGDFAFVLYDRSTGAVFAARDFSGRRPLVYLETRDSLVLASSLAAILEMAGPLELDETSLAEAAAGFAPRNARTAYRGAFHVPAGHSLSWAPSGRMVVERFWEPPIFERDSGIAVDEAAETLLDLIERAVVERMDQAGATSVYLSGGRDSTAVFAAGQRARRDGRVTGRLHPVSLSGYRDDPGCEDSFIEAVADRWGSPVTWLEPQGISLFEGMALGAAERDDLFAHPYAPGINRLASASAAAGARVGLDGYGGDQVFTTSLAFLGDLAMGGRIRTLAHEWRANGAAGWKALWQWVVKPHLSENTLGVMARLRGGRRPLRPLERGVPAWICRDAVARHEVGRAGTLHRTRRAGEGLSGFHSTWCMTHPVFPMILSEGSRAALMAGVENRSPLYDLRVIEFAATRPRHERRAAGDTKVLLRRAMRGLIPDHVLAPRTALTGTTEAWVVTQAREAIPHLVADLRRECALAAFGLVDREQFCSALERFARHPDGDLFVSLYGTLQTEYWVRARTGIAAKVDPHPPPVPATAGV